MSIVWTKIGIFVEKQIYMAIIRLENMQFYAFHGCYSQEQLVGNRFRVDLDFEVDSSQAELSDSIEDTVSYLDVYELVRDQMGVKSHILEHVARRILDCMESRFSAVTWVRVKVVKLAPPLGGQLTGVSVVLERPRPL